MDFEGIKDIIKAMDSSTLDYLEVNWQGISFVMKKTGEPIVVTTKKELPAIETSMAIEKVQEKAMVKVVEKPIDIFEDKNLFVTTSPIVGTFYSAPGPGKADFVKTGVSVKKGDTLCVLEAMKLMNEIQSEVDGEIVEVLVKNGEMVEYNQPLFKIKSK